MAEQSMFWPTTGTGDGVSGGYTADRLATIWKAMLGDGVLKYQNDLAVTGSGSSSLQIATGAAMVGGYLYENNSSATIATSTLGSATFGLYVIANDTAGSITVSRSVSGTTIGTKTVRLALNSTAPTQPYIQLASVTTVAGAITTITPTNGRWSTTRGKTITNYAQLLYGPLGGTLSVLNTTTTTIIGDVVTDSDYVQVNANGTIKALETGAYAVFAQVTWDTNTTNRRRLNIYGYAMQYTASSIISTTSTTQQGYAILNLAAGDTFTVDVWQDSGSTRLVSYADIVIVRL